VAGGQALIISCGGQQHVSALLLLPCACARCHAVKQAQRQAVDTGLMKAPDDTQGPHLQRLTALPLLLPLLLLPLLLLLLLLLPLLLLLLLLPLPLLPLHGLVHAPDGH
jgi:hypothetical protein